MTNFSRRTLLQGSLAAAASASMMKLLTRPALANTGGIKRVIFWYVPEGAAQQAFWPGVGPGSLNINMNAAIAGQNIQSKGNSINSYRSMQTGTWCLQPLKAHESDMLLVSGFANGGFGAEDAHKKVVNSALAGKNGTLSLDQMLGEHLQGTAPFHAMVSTLFGAHAHHTASADYLTPVRMAGGGAGSPTWNPVTTYNQIFPSGVPGPATGEPTLPPVNHALENKLALLGNVRGALNNVRCKGGSIAQSRMEAYLDSVERIESQTQGLVDAEQNAPPPPANVDLRFDVPSDWLNTNNSSKYWTNSDNFGALARIQVDTAVAALALDRTRVAFLQFSGSGNDLGVKNGPYDGLHYRKVVPDLEGSGVLNDHAMGHWANGENINEFRNQARVFRWYYSELNRLIDRLKEIPDGEGSLFDSTLIVCCSEFGSHNHRPQDVPYILIGNPGGAFIPGGQYLDAHNGSHRNHADLLLAIARGMGMDLDSLGDSSNAYNAILA